MPRRRFPPLLVWTLVAASCAVLLGGSFVYAAQVGDPTVRADALRRPDRPSRSVTTVNGLGGGLANGGLGSGGVGSPGIDPATGRGTFVFSAADFERALPSLDCTGVLQTLAEQDQVDLDEVTDAWNAVERCAVSEGQPALPPLALLTADPLSQQCLAVALSRATLTYRSPATPTASLDRLLLDCQARGAVPAVAGLNTGVAPPAVPPPGAGPVNRSPTSSVGTAPSRAPSTSTASTAPPAG